MGTLKVNGKVNIGNNLRLWSDGEGANLRLYTPGNSNNMYELDTCNNLLRLYYSTDGGSNNSFNWYFKNDGTFDSNSITTESLSSRSISSGQIWITDGTSGTHPMNQSLVLHSSKYTDINQAPGISGYIEGKNWSTLKFMPDGSWRFYDSACSSYYPVYASTFYGALSGNASSATEADKLDGYHASSFLLKSGGTMTGTLTINNSNSKGGYVSIYEDSEGGTIRIGSKNGTYNWEMDAYNDTTFRIFTHNGTKHNFFQFNGSNGNFSIPGNLAIGGNTITFAGAMTQITSPTVVAGYIDNNSANGMGWISTSSLSVGYAATAGNADTIDGHHFHWSGQSGQPTWLWGGNDYGNMYVYNPSNFSVSYANSAKYSSSSNALASTGWGHSNFTYLQTDGNFYGNSGWSHYLISNHGDGSNYYNFVIALPFWSYPKYKRMTGGSEGSWYNFHTTENVIIQSSTPGAGFQGQIWFKI